jgi:hypothetical protein
MVWSWIEEAGGWSVVTRLPFYGLRPGKSIEETDQFITILFGF